MSDIQSALRLAQQSGQPIPLQGQGGSDSGLVVYPDGRIGSLYGGGFGAGGSVGAAPSPNTAPSVATGNWPGQGRSTSLGNWPGQTDAQTWTSLLPQQPPNFNIRPASPVMPAPNATMPVGGMTPSPSGGIPYGPAVPQQFGPPVPANLAHQAARYRATHGVPAAGDADLLNAQSLAAAQQGRTAFNPQLAAVYGGGTVPGFNVTNALQAPPAASRWQPNNVNFLAGQPAYGSGLGPQW